ncbi:MAG: 2-alkenal reductase, partial [Pseudomonas sp.]
MLKALRFFGWPLLVGVLVALLIMQHYPHWVGLPRQDVHLQQAPRYGMTQQGPASYA